jgi:hypothetical protein
MAHGGSAGRVRRGGNLAPLAATLLLTAAIFLLPTAGQGAGASLALDDIAVSTTHMAHEGAARWSAAHE